METISSEAEQKEGAESLAPVEKAPNASHESKGVIAESQIAVQTAVADSLNAIGNLVSGSML